MDDARQLADVLAAMIERTQAMLVTSWADVPVHRRWEKHRAVNSGVVAGRYIERCSCGAWGPAPWRDPERRRPLIRKES